MKQAIYQLIYITEEKWWTLLDSNQRAVTSGFTVRHLRPLGQTSTKTKKSGSSTWARTRDPRINSPALYQLSYRGIKKFRLPCFGSRCRPDFQASHTGNQCARRIKLKIFGALGRTRTCRTSILNRVCLPNFITRAKHQLAKMMGVEPT